MSDDSAILLISCPDKTGIVAAVTQFLSLHSGNVIDLDQHVDSEHNAFFMRIEWELKSFKIPIAQFSEKFDELAKKFSMTWELRFPQQKMRLALFVTKESHCLYDLLARYRSDEWNVEIPLIVSNRPDLKHVAEQFEIPFHVFSITAENKIEQEAREIELLDAHRIDTIVLARYMQILSSNFTRRYAQRIINIHHSFLPAFPGARPYHSAFERGVKIIGATSHYVTDELDKGPIIDQDVVRISHKDSVEDMIRKGKDVEKIVLSRAITYHVEHRVLVYKNRTVIFI